MINTQRGNVLFLILIGVLLFAALSYAITSANRGTGSAPSQDKAKANAAVILQNVTNIRNAISRLRLVKGCGESELDFSNKVYVRNDGVAAITANTNAPSSKKCHVFDPAGGNVVPLVAPKESWVGPEITLGSGLPKPGHGWLHVIQIQKVGTDGPAGTVSANDLILRVYYLNRETCLALNNALGVTNPGGEPPPGTTSGTGGSYVNGSFASTSMFTDTNTIGKVGFCRGGSGVYELMYALIER